MSEKEQKNEMPTEGMEPEKAADAMPGAVGSPTEEMPTGDMGDKSAEEGMPTGGMDGGDTSGEMPTEDMGDLEPPDGGGPTEAEEPPQRSCAVMDVHRRLLVEDERYALNRSMIENLALAFDMETTPFRAQVIRIPVVVHVVWRTPAENISQAQIDSQIAVLNRDFRAQNSDISTVPSVFSGLVSDSRIEFFLATEDKDGNPTSGVTRRQTTVASFTHDDKIKSQAAGGQDPWPTDKYLNIWVGKLGGGLLGYAQFPGGPANTDGVVITHTGFGTVGTAAAPFDKGRTATHEIGHWLNLFHIWGDDGTGCGGSDQCADTPNQAGPNTGVPSFPHVTCGNGPNGDLFMNYMDYVDDGAMVMFTKGQVERMLACLNGPRDSFLPVEGAPSVSGPAVAWGANRLDVFVIGTDSGLYHKWWNGSAWGPSTTGYENQGGRIISSPEVAAWGPNRLDVFVIGTDSGLYHKWWNGSAWGPSLTGYENMGGRILGNPKAVAWGPNRLDVFVIGTDSGLYHKWWNGSAWGPSLTGYENMGGRIISDPEAVAWGPNRLDVFVIGTDSGLYHKWWNGSAWGPSLTGYENMGGRILGNPKAVAWGPNRLDVFVTGTDSALYHKWWNGSAWGPSLTGYENLGGRIISDPQVVSWGPNRLDIFAIGTDSALYHKWWNGSSWGPSVTGWENLGGRILGQPRVVSWGPNRLDVFVIGTDSALYHKWWNGSSWGPSTTGYQNMGGRIIKF
jgi:hypothetical protein